MLRRLMAAVMALLIGGTACVPVYAKTKDTKTSSQDEIRILFTHDLHDHALPWRTQDSSGEVVDVGGYAYLKRAIDENRTENSILVDGGDFSMGSLFSFLFRESSPSLSLLGSMGYDAVTLGDHEFDNGPAGLAESLEAGKEIPSIVMANIGYGNDEDAQKLKKVMDEKDFGASKVVECNGMKIGIFGVMGKSSADDITNGGSVTFSDEVEAARSTVKDLKSRGCDVIVALSHSGTDSDPDSSEDEILARRVDGIDVIISGHTHTVLQDPVMVDDTAVVSAGCYGRYLGVLDLDVKDHSVKEYKLVSIDSSLEPDPGIGSLLEGYKKQIQEDHLDAYGYDMDDVLAGADFSLDSVDDLYGDFGNSNLGDFVSDAFYEEYERWYERYAEDFQKQKEARIDAIIEKKGLDQNGIPTPDPNMPTETAPPAEASEAPEEKMSLKDQLKAAWEGTEPSSEPVSAVDPEVQAVQNERPVFVNTPVAVTAAGAIRGTILKGDQTIQDAFSIAAFGSGNDGDPGNPMILAFLKGSDLRKVCEIDATVGQSMMKEARLYFAGMKYDYDDQRMSLNKVEETYVEQSAGYYMPVVDDALYPVITDRYTGQMMTTATDLAKGQLDITIYDQEGNETEDIDSLILTQPDTHEEIMEWQTIASHLEEMNTVDGKPMLPASYKEAQVVRKEDPSFSLLRYFRHTSAYAAKVYLIIVVLIASAAAALTFLMRFILNRIHSDRD